MLLGRGRKATRPWWQRLIRAGLLAVALLVAAYITLPQWAPTGIIRNHLAAQMAGQMGVPVGIESLSLSWSDGVRLENLRIGSTDEPIVFVPSLRTELAPLDMFLRGRLEWMELDRPCVWVNTGPTGELNLAPLSKLKSDIQTQRISLRAAEVAVQLPGQDRPLRLHVSDGQYLAGRTGSLGRVSLSALLSQDSDETQALPATISLSAAAGVGEQAADVKFTFAQLDLARLELPSLLNLPLEHLRGMTSGSLNLQVTHQGLVDQFGFNVAIRELDVQPTQGPELPVINEAGFRIAAAYDPLTGRLDLHSASVRLPGLNLAGEAALFTDASHGQWRAVSNLDLKGTVHPERLAAVLMGWPTLPGELQVSGPVETEISLRGGEQSMAASLQLNAEAASISRQGHQIKPAGRPLELALKADLDGRTWMLDFDNDTTMLTVGENTFRADGRVRDVRPWLELLGGQADAGRPRGWMRALALVEADGTWEIRQLQALTDLLGNAPFADEIHLDGAIAGRWSVQQFDTPELHLSAVTGPDTMLTVGELLRKEPDAAWSIDLSARLDSDKGELRRINGDLTLGEGHASLIDGMISFEGESSQDVTARVRFQAQQVADLLTGWQSEAALPTKFDGNLQGDCSFALRDGKPHMTVQVDLGDLEIEAPPAFRKPAGRAASLAISLESDDSEDRRPKLNLNASLPPAQLNATITQRAWHGRDVMLAKLNIPDAAAIADCLPLAADRLMPGSLGGPITAELQARWVQRTVDFEFTCQADELAFATASEPVRRKLAGSPLSIKLKGMLAPTDPGNFLLTTHTDQLLLPDCRAYVSGGMEIVPPGDQRPMSVVRVEYGGDILATLGPALAALVPELGTLMDRHGMSGEVRLAGKVFADDQNVRLNAEARADDLTIRRLGPLTKPAGLPISLELDLRTTPEFHSVQLDNLLIDLDGATILADGKWTGDPQVAAPADHPGQANGHLSARIHHAEVLSELVAELPISGLSGEAFLDCQWAFDAPDNWRLDTLDLRADQLAATYKGKPVALNGSLSASDVRPDRQWDLRVGRASSDGLELTAGETHCWLLGDLADLPRATTGELHVLAASLDAKELQDWLAPPSPETVASAATQPYHLSQDQAARLLVQAQEMLTGGRDLLGQADFQLILNAETLQTFDPAVGQSYLLRNVAAQLGCKQGQVETRYAAGLNGGTVRGRYAVDLAEAQPVVDYETSMHDVVATENIQPQLAKYFPGNTVYGLFNRSEESSVSLENLLANTLDYRFPLRPRGSARTITTDGLVEGRSAPKFVTRIFRGLNLTRYRYNRMTSFAEFQPDGLAVNDMVFSGQTYDMYIEGTTDAENIGRYEIGLILLGTPQSAEWNHLYRQGRIPILKLTARIEGGKMHDEEVSYPWPNETLFTIFLKNNIFYRLWLASKQP